MDDLVDRFVTAWERWASQPTDRARVAVLERVCQEVAERCGVSCTVVRTWLVHELRQGRELRWAVEELVESCAS